MRDALLRTDFLVDCRRTNTIPGHSARRRCVRWSILLGYSLSSRIIEAGWKFRWTALAYLVHTSGFFNDAEYQLHLRAIQLSIALETIS